MRKKVGIPIALALTLGGGIGLGTYIQKQNLNPRATFPRPFETVLSSLVKLGTKEDDDLLYYNTNLSDFILNGSQKTKVTVEGIVDKIDHEPDGDYHVLLRTLSGDNLLLVTEFIPEIKLSLPHEGDHIKIWGIVRLDILHNWWEIHPAIGWKKK